MNMDTRKSDLPTVPMTAKLKRYAEAREKPINDLIERSRSFNPAQLPGKNLTTNEIKLLLHRRARMTSTKYIATSSVTAMLENLLHTYEPISNEEQEWRVLEGLFPPPHHQWIEFDRSVQTPDGPIGAIFFQNLYAREDLQHLALARGHDLERAYHSFGILQLMQRNLWTIDFLTPDARLIRRGVLFAPESETGQRWQFPLDFPCPYGACIPTHGFPCETCQAMITFVRRFVTVLQAALYGFFREVEIKEQTRTAIVSQRKQQKAKKRATTVRHFACKVIDISRRQTTLRAEEVETLKMEAYAWIAGRPVIPLDSIDWEHPPQEDDIVLAYVPVGTSRRTLRDERRYKPENIGKEIPVAAYTKHRIPMYFKNWRRYQWNYVRVKAALYQQEKSRKDT